jgi:cytoskeleton protein RodZ
MAAGLSVHQLAEITKIKTDHIRALEDGNYSVFAAPVYIRGFVRNCAKVLKMDVPSIMSALDAELRARNEFDESPGLHPGNDRLLDQLMLQLSKVRWRIALPVLALTVAILAGFVGYHVWQGSREKDPLSGLEPARYQTTSSRSGDTLPLPPAPTTRK